MKPYFLFLSFVVTLTACSHAEKKLTASGTNPLPLSMDKNAQELLSDPKINAVSIGVYKDGKKYIRHYGELDKGKGNTPTDHTLYEIASVSKTLTGVLAAKAVLEGRLTLNEDIRTYLKGRLPQLCVQGQAYFA